MRGDDGWRDRDGFRCGGPLPGRMDVAVDITAATLKIAPGFTLDRQLDVEGSLPIETGSRRVVAAPAQPLDLNAALGHAAPDRLTLLVMGYLLAPAVLFLSTWLVAWAALLAVPAAVAALALAPGWRGIWPTGRATTLGCLFLGLLWALGATGTHHLLYSAADWQIRDAVLLDLTRNPGPVVYTVGEETWLLRAPMGYYMPAALLGHALGFGVAQAALWAWTGLGPMLFTLRFLPRLYDRCG